MATQSFYTFWVTTISCQRTHKFQKCSQTYWQLHLKDKPVMRLVTAIQFKGASAYRMNWNFEFGPIEFKLNYAYIYLEPSS